MTTIDPNSAQAALFEKLGISKQSEAQKATKDTLGQSDFLKLMTTQLQNQDPFAPYGQWRLYCSDGSIFNCYWY